MLDPVAATTPVRVEYPVHWIPTFAHQLQNKQHNPGAAITNKLKLDFRGNRRCVWKRVAVFKRRSWNVAGSRELSPLIEYRFFEMQKLISTLFARRQRADKEPFNRDWLDNFIGRLSRGLNDWIIEPCHGVISFFPHFSYCFVSLDREKSFNNAKFRNGNSFWRNNTRTVCYFLKPRV